MLRSLHDGYDHPAGSALGEFAAAEAVDDHLLAFEPCRIFPPLTEEVDPHGRRRRALDADAPY